MAKQIKREEHFRQAQRFQKAGKFDQALQQYRIILDARPDDLEVRRLAGELYVQVS